MKRRAGVAAGALSLIAAGLVYYQFGFMNFAVVDPGRLLRMRQPRAAELDQIRAEYGLGTILCVRGKEAEDVRDWARAHQVKVIMFAMKADDPPTEGQIGAFFDLMRDGRLDPGLYPDAIFRVIGVDGAGPMAIDFPVLIHCRGGSDRTGVMVALYRMAFMGWTVDQAKSEMRRHLHLPPVHPRQFEFLDQVAGQIDQHHGSRVGKGAK